MATEDIPIGGGVATTLMEWDRVDLHALIPPLAAGGTPRNDFIDHGGPVLTSARVVLVFWGTAWATIPPPTPSAGEIADAVAVICAGQYMNSLRQYRNIGRASLQEVVYVTAAVGSAAANPPNPFSDNDVGNLINQLCIAGRVPSPAADNQLFYCVIMPRGVNSTNGNFIGEHTYSTIAGVRAHWAWVTNNGSLASVTSIFSHELVETCTDPEGNGWTGNVCNQGGWCEIGDVCNTTANVDGVTVQRYWSNFDGQCVVPTDAIVKTHTDTKDTKDKEKDSKDRKDRKDRKEVKDGKEKEKDAKEKDRDLPDLQPALDRIESRLQELAVRVAAIEAGGSGKASFIGSDERPEVGGGVLGPNIHEP